ncbi:MAG TPA: S9 family peptidase [Chitinophagaceae bacterium]|nr:S9 family peptidase [Chitinophagaceae bacterium]
MQKWVLLLFVFSLNIIAFSQQGKDPVRVTDMLKIKSVSGAKLNKDGSKAVFTVTSIEPDGESKLEYKYVSQLWIAHTEGDTRPKQITTAKENSSQASFSPDGKQLAFVRTVDGKPQLFLLPLEGGEAMQLTRFKYGAGSPQWSPDGKQLLFSANIPFKDLLKDSLVNPGKELPKWNLEKPGFANNAYLKPGKANADPDGSMEEVRAYLDNNAADKKAKVFTKLNFLDEMDINPDMGFNHFFLIDAMADARPRAVTKGFYRYSSAAFTPDGKQLILSGNMDSTRHPDRVLEGEIYLVNTDGSNLRKILGEKEKVYSSPVISPSGNWLAFQYSNTSFVSIPALAVMPLNGAVKEAVDIPFDRNKGNITWSDDEQYIYFTAQSNGGQPVYRADLGSGWTLNPPLSALKNKNINVEQLTDFNSGIGSFDIAGNKLAVVKTEVANPFEVYVSDASGKSLKRISDFNTNWIADKKLSYPEKHSFKNEKGMEAEYWVMKPSNYEPGKKYPLLLEIHGGPSSMWGPGESSMWHEYQFFCSKGYGVVYSNPRGSGGYGLNFLRGNINDWGTGPAKDVLTALDKTVAEGWADTSKLMVTGGSYAGYLVAWIIAHDQRFAAACSQRGVYDLATFLGEGNAWRLVPNYFGGYPWEPAVKATLERESPINYVQNIKTPYIIFHGDNDRRTGFVQSEMLYKSLKVLGRPVEYVRHPNATHELTRSGNNRQRIDQMLRTWEFFERWIHK